VSGKCVQALYTGGHTAGTDAGNLCYRQHSFVRGNLVAVSDVCLVRSLISGGKLWFFGQTVLVLHHQTTGLKGAERSSCCRMG
jgi:hypothetical protein